MGTYRERRPVPDEQAPDVPFSPDDLPLSGVQALKAELAENGGRLTDMRIRAIFWEHGFTLPAGPDAVARAMIYAGAIA